MQTKKYVYAAVGAPVLAAKTARQRAEELRSRLTETAQARWKGMERQIDGWAGEGEKVVSRLTDGTTIDELTAKMDIDQVSEQVTKLRDQLEDLLATWRTNFRPEQAPTPAEPAAEKSAASATSSGSKSSGSKSSGSKASSAKSTGSKASSAKKTTATKKTSTQSGSAKSSQQKAS